MCTPAQKMCSKAEINQSTDQSINTLSHKPVHELSKEEVQERRTFLKEQLVVKNMIINQDQQEQVIDLFMKHITLCQSAAKIMVHHTYYSSI